MRKILSFIITIALFLGLTGFAFADTSYLYYYGQGCPHCANIDKYMKGVDGYNRINIEKKEVYFNQDNAKSMSQDAESLGIKQEELGVPFLIVDNDGEKSYLIWDGPIIDHFTPILGEPQPSNAKYIVLGILVLLAVIIPAGIIMWGKKS